MQVLSQLIVVPLVLGLISLQMYTSAKPYGKKYKHHVKSRDHLEDDLYDTDNWSSPGQWKRTFDSFGETTGKDKNIDKFSNEKSKKALDLKNLKPDAKSQPQKKVYTGKNPSKAYTDDYSYKAFKESTKEPVKNGKGFTDEKKEYSKSAKGLDKDVPSDPHKKAFSGKGKDNYQKITKDKEWKEAKKVPAPREKDNGSKFGLWPIGDDTDKLPQPTTTATKLHQLRQSKGLVKCKAEMDCPMSRVCKDGLCHCAEKGYCVGHNSPVCGSDGILYPSHCELHRTACVKAIHIKIDHKGLCFEKEKGSDTVGFLPVPILGPIVPGGKGDYLKKKDKDDLSKEKKKVYLKKDPDLTEREKSFLRKRKKPSGKDGRLSEKEKIALNEKKSQLEKEKSLLEEKEKSLLEEKEKSQLEKEESSSKKGDNLSEKKDLSEKEATSSSSEEYGSSEEKKSKDKKINDDKDYDFKKNDKYDDFKKEYELKSMDDDDYVETKDKMETKNPEELKSADLKKHPYYEDGLDPSKESYDNSDLEYYVDLKTLTDIKEELEKKGDNSKSPDVAICPDEEYKKFKEELLRYHCQKFEEPDCKSETIEKRKFLASIMFSYYDRDFDDFLEKEELAEIEMDEHFEKLSPSCILMDILRLEDSADDKDGRLSIEEFFQAFNVDNKGLDEKIRVISLLATVGHGLELSCGITGAKDIIWKRHGVDVNALHMDDISAFEDGTLYISHISVHHMGNFSCHDRNHPALVQTHMIKVQMPPQVKVMPSSQLHRSHTDVVLKCHAEGIPAPKVTWEINEVSLPEENKHFERMNENRTLVIHDSDYQTDTGAYKCRAANMAGISQDIATVFIQNYNSTHTAPNVRTVDDMFIVFHDQGYDIYEPQHCLVRHEVKGDYTNIRYFPENVDTSPPSMCMDQPCDWGAAINVENKFVYVSQPNLNRVVIIDVTVQWNPVQFVETDKKPVTLHYVQHLDQVWVLCWNGGQDSGSKTIVVIREASKDQRHYTVHPQPVGNRFDLIQDMFLPPVNDLGHHFQFGYVVHTGQRGLYKVQLEEMKYIKAIDFSRHNCHPKSIVFIPLGGMIVLQCQAETKDATHHFQLVVDYLSDIVLSNSSIRGRPYVSPDSRNLVTIDSITGEVDVQSVTDEGVLKKEFSVTTGTPISEVAFHPADNRKGYDIFLNSRTKGTIYYMNLANGKLQIVQGVGERVQDSWLWDGKNHALVGSGIFGDYLLTTTESSAIIINGQLRQVQCEFRGLKNSHVVVWIRPELDTS